MLLQFLDLPILIGEGSDTQIIRLELSSIQGVLETVALAL